ncbi:MAG: transglycosylase family protein [Candidatus Eisenbacteria bacterium]
MATIASAAPSGADQARGPKLDKLHAVRPTAAMSSVLAPSRAASVEVGKLAHADHKVGKAGVAKRRTLRRRLREYLDALAQAQARVAAEAATPAAPPAPGVAEPTSGPVESSSNPGDFLACVRNRESGGDYGIRNQGDSGAAGAYQFLPSTWDSTAASVGRSDLVGVDPAQATPEDQDAMAQALYAEQGAAPWGGGCG